MDLEKNKYQRAIVARAGLFALRESEVLYYIAREDSEGNPLSSKYAYELKGQPFNARYWSFTLYGSDFFLIDNPENSYNINMDNVIYEDSLSQNYRIHIAPDLKEGNWLPSGKDEDLTITLRLYNPDPSIYQNLETTPLPTIKKVVE